MIDLDIYRPGEVIAGANLVSFEGDGRSGKGTCVTAVTAALQEDGRNVYVIDQGLKFRALGYGALEAEISFEMEDIDAKIEAFLEAENTRTSMLALLGHVSTMPKDEIDALLYTDPVAHAAKKIAGNRLSHQLAVGIMFDEVAEAKSNGTNTVLIDGRAMEKYARQMHDQKLGVYALGFYFQCDSFPAARRVRQDFRDVKDMSVKEKLALLDTVVNISQRNADDAQRRVDPMVNADHAFNLDLLRGLPDDPDERAEALDQIIETGVVAVNTSYTTGVDQMLQPVTEVTRHVLADTDRRRQSWKMLDAARRSVIERIPDTASS